MNKFKVGDFIVAQDDLGQPDFGVVVKLTSRQSQLCGDTTHYDMLSVRFPTGTFISFVDECQHYEDWLKDNGV